MGEQLKSEGVHTRGCYTELLVVDTQPALCWPRVVLQPLQGGTFVSNLHKDPIETSWAVFHIGAKNDLSSV